MTMTAQDRIAHMLGRLIIDQEVNADALAAVQAELGKAREQLAQGKKDNTDEPV